VGAGRPCAGKTTGNEKGRTGIRGQDVKIRGGRTGKNMGRGCQALWGKKKKKKPRRERDELFVSREFVRGEKQSIAKRRTEGRGGSDKSTGQIKAKRVKKEPLENIGEKKKPSAGRQKSTICEKEKVCRQGSFKGNKCSEKQRQRDM